MTGCTHVESGQIELYFYGELEAGERASVARHVAACADCRLALEELSVIREALAARPAVASPPGGDWTGFMARLGDAVAAEETSGSPDPIRRVVASQAGAQEPAAQSRRRAIARAAPYLAMAALLTLVTIGVASLARSGPERAQQTVPAIATVSPPPDAAGMASAAVEPDGGAALQSPFALLSEQHLERSKLVVLGIASKDAQSARLEDWEYERELASDLLTETRLYRMAAEERGMTTIADVMRDLELVLLQTSLAADSGPEDLAQIQRLIDKRDLVTKMALAAGI